MKAYYMESRNIKIAKFFLLFSCLYGTTDYCIPDEMTKHYKSLHGSKYIFLTNICLYLTIICLLLGLITKKYNIKQIKKIYKHTVSVLLPLNGLVTILFWTLYSINPTLIRDKTLYDKNIRISLFTDMCVHLFPFISLLIESQCLILKRNSLHLLFYVGFCTFYYLLSFYYSILNKEWVYPILGKLNLAYRILFFTGSAILAMGIYEASMFYLVNKKL